MWFLKCSPYQYKGYREGNIRLYTCNIRVVMKVFLLFIGGHEEIPGIVDWKE